MKPEPKPTPEADPGARPFPRDPPEGTRIPAWLSLVTALAIGGGVALGALTPDASPGLRLSRAVFFASAFAYFSSSMVDFWEHVRLEHAATGRWLAWKVVPLGETVNHMLTTTVLVILLMYLQPPSGALTARDAFFALGPVCYFALGWRDEIVYHRRRAVHREDLMHTVSHLAGGAMLAALYAMRLGRW